MNATQHPEPYLTLAEASRLAIRPIHISTLTRWVLTGVKLRDGTTVRLKARKFGGRWLTTESDLQAFMDATTPTLDGEQAPAPRTPTQRERDAAAATAELAKHGVS